MLAARDRPKVALAAFALLMGSTVTSSVTHCQLGTMPEWKLVLQQGMGPLASQAGQFGWWGGLFVFWGIARLYFSQRVGLVSSLLGLGFALNGFFWVRTVNDDSHMVCSRGPGFYFWVACAALIAAVAIIEFIWNDPDEAARQASSTRAQRQA